MYLILCRALHPFHTLQLLFFGPGKGRLRWLMLSALSFFFPVLAVIACIPGQHSAGHLHDCLRHLVQKEAVMGDHHHGMLIPLQILLQPLDRFDIQMVGRLI